MAIPVSVGATVGYTFQFESSYGVVASGNYITAEAFRLAGLRGEEALQTDPTLGSGREPSTPFRGAFNVNAEVEMPIDQRLFPYFLKNLMGAAQSPGTLGARGYIEFTAQPSADQTITLNGVTWTFKASGATGNETNIGASLQATLDQLVIDLNASADTDIDDATYSRLGNRLVIAHDTADNSGDAYTLATNVTGATVSKATLYGGGLISHQFRSDTISTLSDIESITIQADDPALAGGNRYIVADGIWLGSLAFTRNREGVPHATFSGRGRSSVSQSSSVAGTPTTPTVDSFFQKQGFVLLDDIKIEAANSLQFNFSQGLLVRETLVDDGKIEAVDPGKIELGLSIEAIYSDNALKQASDAESTVSAKVGYLDKTTGAEILFDFGELHLPKPNVVFQGEGYTIVTYDLVGAKGATRSLTVTVINDVASYT